MELDSFLRNKNDKAAFLKTKVWVLIGW